MRSLGETALEEKSGQWRIASICFLIVALSVGSDLCGPFRTCPLSKFAV